MSTAIAPRTPESVTAEAAAIERGWAVYRRAQDAMWPESVRRTIAAAVMDLHGALDLYGYLLNDLIHPASVDGWDDLEHEPEAYAERRSSCGSDRHACIDSRIWRIAT